MLDTSAGTNEAINPTTDTRVDENGFVSTYFNLGKKAGSGSSSTPNTTPLCGTYTLPEVLATADEFELSFDCWVGAHFYGTAPLGFALRSGSDNVFVMYAIGNNSTGHIKYWAQAASDYSDANATDATITVPGRGANPKDNAYWHHIVVSGNRTDGTMSIKVTRPLVDSTTVFEKTVKFANISSVYMVLRSSGSGYTSYMAFDNFYVYTVRPEGIPNAPVISADEGTGKYVRTITITADEGATVTYKIDDGEEQTYTGPFSLPNSGKVYAYATKNDISSETVSEYYYSNLQAITLNAPTSITRRGFNRVYAIASQSNKTGAPVPTFAYQGGTMTAESSAVASASTHSAVMYVDGFDDSSTVAIRATNSDYADSATVNFSAVDLSVPTSGKYAKYEIDFLQYFTDNGASVAVGNEISDGYRNILSSSKSEIYDKVLFTESMRWGASTTDGLTRGNVDASIKFLDLAAGDLIYVNASGVSATSTCAKDNTYSSGHEVVFSVSQNGDAVIKMSKNTDLYAIRVYAQAVASVDGCGIGSLDDLAAKVSRGSVITVFDSSITLEDLATAVGDTYELEAVSGETDKYTVVAKLNAPTLHRYGLTRLYATLSESSVDGSPVATINYLGGTMASAQTQATAASDESKAIVVSGLDSNGSSAEVWATADGYADSAKTTYTSYSVSASSYVKTYEFDYVEYCTEHSGRGNLWYTDEGGYDSDGNYTEDAESMTYKGLKVNYYNTILSNPLWFQNIDNKGTPRWRTINQTALNLQTLSGTILFKAMKSGALIYVNADSPSNPVNMTLTSSSNAKEYLYTVNSTLDGSTVDAKLTFAGNSNIYAIRIYSPAVASVDGQPYATLQAAADAAAEGATITMTGSTTDGVSLKRGQVLVVGDNSCGTVSGATQYISVSYNETTKSWTAVENATWDGSAGNNLWSDGANWSTDAEPSQYTAVTIPEGDHVAYVGQGSQNVASLTLNGNLTLSLDANQSNWSGINLKGNVSGTGTLTLLRSGLNNTGDGVVQVSCPFVVASCSSDSFLQKGQGFNVTGDIEVQSLFVIYDNSTFSDGTVTLKNGAVVRASESWYNGGVAPTLTFSGPIQVAANATASFDRSGHVLTGAVTLGNGSTLNLSSGTIAAEATFSLGNGAKLVVPSGATVTAANITAATETYDIRASTENGSTTYEAVDNSISTWKSTNATGSWKDASNWENGVVPSSYTDVVFPAGEYTVYISDHNWDPWTERDKAKGMTVNGTVTLQKNGGGWNYLSLYGDIGGTGTLKLTWTGLENFTGREMVIGCDLEIVKVEGHDSYLNQINGNGYRLTGNVTVNGLFQVWEGVSFTKALTFADAGSMVVGADESDTLAIANVVVQSGVSASISGASTATITGTVTLAGEGATLAVPTKMAVENSQLKSLVAGKKVAGTTNEGIVTYALTDLDTVTVSGVTATYGADFATADVTVAMTGATEGQKYTMSVGGKDYSGTAASNGSVTFSGVETGHDSAYDSFTYTVSSDDVTVSGDAASGSKTIADEAAWFQSNSTTTEGGAWKNDLSWSEGKATIGDGNQFTPTPASSASVVDVTVQVCFGDANNDAIELTDAKAAVKIAMVNDSPVFQALNDGEFVTLTGVTPVATDTYNVTLHLDYAAKKYTVKIGDVVMLYAESSESDKTLLAMPSTATAMTAVAFQGQGTLTSLVGETSEGYVAMDAAGNRYLTLDAAMTTAGSDRTKLPLTVLHNGTLNNETYAKSAQVLPTGVNNVSITAASQEAANAAAANMEIALTSDQVTQGLKKDYYKAVATKNGDSNTYTLSIELDEEEVAPTVAADADDSAMKVTTSSVSLNVTNTKAGLYYGIAAGDTPETVAAGEMKKCETDGQDLDLTADMPESGVKYYKVIVDDKGTSSN